MSLPRTLPEVGFVTDFAYIGLEIVGDRAWLEPGMTNPRVPRSKGYAGLSACLHAAESYAREHGIRTLFAFTDHPAMGCWITGQQYRESRGYLVAKEM